MFQKLSSLFLAIIFIVLFSLEGLLLWQFLLGIGGLIVLTTVINFFVHGKGIHRVEEFTFLLFPVLWIGASTVVIFLQNTKFWEIVFVYVLGIVFFRLQLNLRERTNSVFLENIFFLSSFGIFLGIWAIDFFFTPAWWLIMALVFVFSVILFWTGIFNTHADLKEKIIYSLLLAFALTEISWALLFWPLHFVSIAIVISVIFYLAWTITRLHFLGLLNKKKIAYYSGFSFLIIFVTLSTAVWLPIV